ncbi:MAG: hypothetical protein WCQ00_04125 [bacterium]
MEIQALCKVGLYVLMGCYLVVAFFCSAMVGMSILDRSNSKKVGYAVGLLSLGFVTGVGFSFHTSAHAMLIDSTLTSVIFGIVCILGVLVACGASSWSNSSAKEYDDKSKK